MPSVKVTTLFEGVPRFITALKRTDAGTRERTLAAIRRGAAEVLAQAEARVARRTTELAQTGRVEEKPDALVAFVKFGYGKLLRRSRATTAEGFARFQERRRRQRERLAKAKSSKSALAASNLGVYAPVVERGDPRRHKPAKPFLVPALREERENIAADIRRAPIDAAKESGLV